MNLNPTSVQSALRKMTTTAFCIQKTATPSSAKRNLTKFGTMQIASGQKPVAPRSVRPNPNPLPEPIHLRVMGALTNSSPPVGTPRPNTPSVATILVADDHAMFREGLCRVLVAAGFTVVGEAATGHEAVEKASCLQPDVVVLDIAMPQLYGIEACQRILAGRPATKVVLLSGYSDDEFIERAAAAGAAGYVVKQNSTELLLRAIREVVKGNHYFSQPISRRMAYNGCRSRDQTGHGPASASLTPREREVLQLVAEGASNKEIASTLDISIKTVEKHRQHLMEKLDIHEIAGLTRYAIATRLIESSVSITVT